MLGMFAKYQAFTKRNIPLLSLVIINLLFTSLLYRYISGDISYLANDAWQFIDDAFAKTRGASRYLTIFAHPYLHNLKPFVANLLDAVSFLLIFWAFTSGNTGNSLQKWFLFFAALTIPFWGLTVNWYPWPGQMSLINFSTAFYIHLILTRSKGLYFDLFISVVFVFVCMAYYEVYCLFPALMPLFKKYNLKQYLIFMVTLGGAILCSYGVSTLYQMHFFESNGKIQRYRVLVDTEGMPFFEKYYTQFAAALEATKTGLFPVGNLWIYGSTIYILLFLTAVKDSLRFLHVIVFIALFVAMFASMNHIIVTRNMAPMFYLPVAIFLATGEKNKLPGILLLLLCFVFVVNSFNKTIPFHHKTGKQINAMMKSIDSKLERLDRSKAAVFIGSPDVDGWKYSLLNAVDYSFKDRFILRRCGEQYQFGECALEMKRTPDFKTWLCSGPKKWQMFGSQSAVYVSIGKHGKLDCKAVGGVE